LMSSALSKEHATPIDSLLLVERHHVS
jgi:hypothetical protein